MSSFTMISSASPTIRCCDTQTCLVTQLAVNISASGIITMQGGYPALQILLMYVLEGDDVKNVVRTVNFVMILL